MGITLADVQARASTYQSNLNSIANQNPGLPLPDHDNYCGNGVNDAFNKAAAAVVTFHDLSSDLQALYDPAPEKV